MTDKEYDKLVKAIRRVRKEAEKSPDMARDLLVRAGIVTEKGNLRKPYK